MKQERKEIQHANLRAATKAMRADLNANIKADKVAFRKLSKEEQERRKDYGALPGHWCMPSHIHYYTKDGIDYSVWSGSRRFADARDGGWHSSDFVAFNKAGTKLHLSEYWGDNMAGIWVKE